MYLLENPVLQRELLVNLRMTRAFVLLLLYLGLLAVVVFLAWPQQRHLDLTSNPEAARRLVNLVFLGQYVLASMMAPSFAAGAIAGTLSVTARRTGPKARHNNRRGRESGKFK